MTTVTAKQTQAEREAKMTPEARAALAAKLADRKAAAIARNQRKANAKVLVEKHGLRMKHFRIEMETPFGGLRKHKGGITVAYRQQGGNSFVEISSTICHPDEVYDYKKGTMYAAEQFDAGHIIRVPTYGMPAAAVLETMFRGLVTFISLD